MWLPDPVYKALPWAYVVMGLMFFAGVYYLDQRDFGSGIYFAVGVMSLAGGLIVHYLRVNAVRPAAEDAEGDSSAS